MERSFNLAVTARLERHIDVFLPQRDGGLLMQHVKKEISPDRAAGLSFQTDEIGDGKLTPSIAVLDGSNIDEGCRV